MSWQGTTTYGSVDYALGALAFMLGDRADARAHLVTALDQSERLQAPLHELRCRMGLRACDDSFPLDVARSLDAARDAGWLGMVRDAEAIWGFSAGR